VKGANLDVYVDEAIRLAVKRAVALETTRGWRIAKEKSSHKIDVVVALAQAALDAVKGASYGSDDGMIARNLSATSRRRIMGRELEAAGDYAVELRSRRDWPT
jgi:hypothetical protein